MMTAEQQTDWQIKQDERLSFCWPLCVIINYVYLHNNKGKEYGINNQSEKIHRPLQTINNKTSCAYSIHMLIVAVLLKVNYHQ